MENEVRFLYLDDIIPNRFQPRENFDEQALKELAVSIKEHGVIQPIVVRQIGNKYEIIAGERRYKASTMAGLTKIPAIIKNLDDKESSKVALIENLQRKDLTPIEEARTYQKILELDALTQEELARTMGKSQSAVSNKLRLLALTDEVQDALLHEQISERHARSLLNVTDKVKQIELLNKVISSRMTVRELDQTIKQINGEISSDDTNGGIVINSNNNMNIAQPSPIIEPVIENNFNDIPTLDLNNSEVSMEQPQEIPSQTKPLFDMSNLLNTNNQPNEIPFDTSQNNSVNEEVIGGSGLLAGMTVDKSLIQPINNVQNEESNPNNLMNNLYQNFNTGSVDNSSNVVDNAVNSLNLSSGINNDSNSKDAESVINNVKNAINTVKNNDNKIEMEEFDFDDFYQIVIRIDKK